MGAQHLTGRQRDTLAEIFVHPVSHNIRWAAIVSLLRTVGSAEQQHNGRFKVHVGDEIEVFDPPKGDHAGEQQIVDLRRMLRGAGYGPDTTGKEI